MCLAKSRGTHRRFERRPAGQHPEEDHAERVEVSGRADPIGLSGRLLRRDEERRPDHHAGHGDAGSGLGLDDLGDAEVQDLEDGRLAVHDEDVLGLEVAVHDALVVRGLKPGGDLLEVRPDLAGGHLAALGQHLLELAAFEQLHHVVEPPVGQRAEVVDGNDIRVIDAGDRARLDQEPLDGLGLLRDIGRRGP